MTPLETVVYLVLLHTHFTAQQPPPIPSYDKIEACSKAGRAGKVVKVTSYPEVCKVQPLPGHYYPPVCTRKEPTVEKISCNGG